MSDTPKTDELAKREFVTDGVWIRHARELERENAALREDKARLDWIDVDPIDHLSKIEFYWCDHSSISKIRANIDAARKEAQP